VTPFERAVEALPKVELHCHVEGTMRPATVVELAAKNGIALPTTDLDQLYQYRSLNEFLDVFWLVQSTLVTRGDWARLAYESIIDAAGHGRRYAETFFTPARHLAAGQSLAEIVAGLDEGIAAAEAESGASAALICDIDRAFGPAAGLELVEQLSRLRSAHAPGCERVIGVGMDSTELGVDPLSFRPAFETARRAGLRLTAHQGENSGPDAIAACVDGLGVERIDHGLSLANDPTLTARFAAERIPLTMCPNSNIRIANAFSRLEDHPLGPLRAAGVLVTVNTDDPALTDLDLGYEYRSVAAAYGWEWDTVVDVAVAGVEACWAPEDTKRVWRRQLSDARENLRPADKVEVSEGE
jgi:adenosine deaminase